MRVTDSNVYRKYTASVNDIHSQLTKSMNKIASGKAYEAAADNPLAYYSGKRMDNQYQDVISKKELLSDIQNRLYQQELGVRSIQSTLAVNADSVSNKITYILNSTNNEISTTVGTIRDDLIQKQQSMINDLNGKYENFYVYGGNDLSTVPFSLSYDTSTDEMKLTYKHKFSGESDATTFEFTLKNAGTANAVFELTSGDEAKLQQAMSEQGRIDIGYGSILDKDTLLDTYTGGLNFLTGITSDEMKKNPVSAADIGKALAKSALGLNGQAIITMNQYMNHLDSNGTNQITKSQFSDQLSLVLDQIPTTSNKLGSVYSDLGNKYNIIETIDDKLTAQKGSLEEQYADKLGADPYDAIMEMFAYQRSYTAALKVSSNLIGTSLFDFMR